MDLNARVGVNCKRTDGRKKRASISHFAKAGATKTTILVYTMVKFKKQSIVCFSDIEYRLIMDPAAGVPRRED